jgi:Bacterial conjugation TrbI-like protein
MPNIPGIANKQPHGVSLWFGGAIGVLVLVVILAFLWSRRSEPPAYNPREFSMNGVNGSWYKRDFPQPTPHTSPTQAPMPAPHVIAPAQVYRPAPTRGPDTAAQERQRMLLRAMASDLILKVPGSNVLEAPQRDPREQTVSLKPAPPHTIVAWNYLYAVLETGINSDHPGDIIARVSQDARDSVSQTEVLIPMGSKLHGVERGSGYVALNDKSVVVTWDDLTLPNGAHVPLPQMPAADTQGYPGLSDQVDRHLASTWGPALLVSAITAGVMLAQTPVYGGYQGYNGEQQATGAFASTLGAHARQGLNADLMINRPTIIVRPGTPLRVLLTRDLVFPGPYQG